MAKPKMHIVAEGAKDLDLELNMQLRVLMFGPTNCANCLLNHLISFCEAENQKLSPKLSAFFSGLIIAAGHSHQDAVEIALSRQLD
jgi:hypothetical protein